MNRYLAIVLLAATLVPNSVSARVLTADNRTQLCTSTYQGKPAVDRDALAYAIVTEAGAGLYLDGSNPSGLRDGAIQLRSMNGIQSEPVYAILNCDIKPNPEENKPFGPNVDLTKDPRALQAFNSIVKIMREELFFLTPGNPTPAGSDLTYCIKHRESLVGAPTTENEWANPVLLFGDDPPLVIVCDCNGETPSSPNPATTSPKQVSSGVSALNYLRSHLRLRGTVKDLTVKTTDLKSASPATISYQRNGLANTDTFGINGVLGWHFFDEDGIFDAIPFISYENRSITGSKGNTEILNPGLLFGYKIERPKFAIHTRLEASWIDDLHYDSSQVTLRVYADPAFALGKGRGVLFGSYLKGIGPLQWRPDLTLIGDFSHVFDTGTNPALSETNNYFGLGGEFRLRTRLNLGQPISDFDLEAGVRYLKLFGGISKQEAHRWFGSLTYSPANFPYIGITLKFSKGENDNTFQDEEIYSLGFTVRY